MAKQIKLKDILKEHTLSMVGGVVSQNAFHNDMSLSNMVKEKYLVTIRSILSDSMQVTGLFPVPL